MLVRLSPRPTSRPQAHSTVCLTGSRYGHTRAPIHPLLTPPKRPTLPFTHTADAKTLTVDKDTTLFEGTDMGGAGGSGILYAGRLGTNGDGLKRRFLISFDLAGAGLLDCNNKVSKV